MSFKDVFNKVNTVKAIFFLLIPLILILIENGFRISISDYVYSEKPFVRDVYVLLVSASGVLFIDSGIVNKKWYNIVLGIFLLGISLTPHRDYKFFHYLFSVLFFEGSCFAIVFFSSKKQRLCMWLISVSVNIPLLLYLIFNNISLLITEWVAMIPLSIHFIGETNNKIQ